MSSGAYHRQPDIIASRFTKQRMSAGPCDSNFDDIADLFAWALGKIYDPIVFPTTLRFFLTVSSTCSA
jgi:hypothetical protein